MLRPSHCNGLIDNTYISILNCHFSPISLQNGWIFTFVLWCQMLASQIGCLKIFITFFPTRPHWMKNPPGGANQREICLSILYLCFSPNCFPLSSKLLHPLLNISMDGGRRGWRRGKLFSEIPVIQLGFCFFWIRQMFNISILWNPYFSGIVSRLNSHQMVKSAHALPSMNRSDRGSIFGQNQKYRPISGPPPPPPPPSYPQTPESKSGVGGKRGSKGVPHVKLDFEYRLLAEVLIGSSHNRGRRKYLSGKEWRNGVGFIFWLPAA